MALGFSISGKIDVSEVAFGQLLCVSAVVGVVCVLVVLARKLWMATAQPQQGEYIEEPPPPPSPRWIHVPLPEEEQDVTPRSEAAREKDTTPQSATDDKDATPGSDTAEDGKAPPWAHVGAPPPSSFEELLQCTPDRLLRCRDRTKCRHTRFTKNGTNGYQARVKCNDCGELLALYKKAKAPSID